MRTTLCVPLLLAAMSGCGGSSTPVVTAPTAAQVAEFTAKASLKLPASARPVGWREERGLDDALWLQVRMPASAVRAFLQGSPFRGAKLDANDPNAVFDFDFPGFLTAPPARFRSGTRDIPNARVLKMLIDESKAASAVVYLMWHET